MKIVFIVNVDWFFMSHRLPLAIEAQKRGFEVYVIGGNTGVGQQLEKQGINFIPWDIVRSGTNIIKELYSILALIKVVKNIHPHIIHNIGIKSVLYGSLTARYLNIPYVNAIAGLGFVFGATYKARLIKFLIKPFFKVIFHTKNSKLIVQNSDDYSYFLTNGFSAIKNIALIKGSGVDLKHFEFTPEPINQLPVVVLPSRMLWDKGVGEFIDAISIFRTKYSKLNVKFVLLGGLDLENPAYVSEKQILEWQAKGLIQWMGYQSDMKTALSLSNIVVLPSYNEGLPKVLIEAAALGRAIITTDVPGCRELIKHNLNGLLVPVKNSLSIADVLYELLTNVELKNRLIQNGYKVVKHEYSIHKVVQSTFNIYSELLNTNVQFRLGFKYRKN